MTNREFAIKRINEVLEQADNTRLADIFLEAVQFPETCMFCADESGKCNCTRGIRQWLEQEEV